MARDAEHGEQQRIERRELARVIGERNGGVRIAGLRMHERQRVVRGGEVGRQVHGALEFGDRTGPGCRAATSARPMAQCAAGSRSSTIRLLPAAS